MNKMKKNINEFFFNSIERKTANMTSFLCKIEYTLFLYFGYIVECDLQEMVHLCINRTIRHDIVSLALARHSCRLSLMI